MPAANDNPTAHGQCNRCGEHTVLFASEDEVISLSHSAIDRSLFAKGAVAAAAWVRTRKPGLYDMQDVLGLKE